MCLVFSSSVLCHFAVRCCSPERIGILGEFFSLCSLISIFPLVSPYIPVTSFLCHFIACAITVLAGVTGDKSPRFGGCFMSWIRQPKGEDWSVSCSHWKAAAWGFAGATEMAVFLSGLLQVSSKGRNLPCYPCVFHTLLNLLSSCPCPIPRFLVLQLGIDNGLTWCICSTF